MKSKKNLIGGINLKICIFTLVIVVLLSFFSMAVDLGISAYLYMFYFSTVFSFWLIHKIETSDKINLPNNIVTRHLRLITFFSLAFIFFHKQKISYDVREFLGYCIGFSVGAAILISIYFLPSVIAYYRKATSRGLIFLLNFIVGWTIIGWVAAFIWSAVDKQIMDEGEFQESKV